MQIISFHFCDFLFGLPIYLQWVCIWVYVFSLIIFVYTLYLYHIQIEWIQVIESNIWRLKSMVLLLHIFFVTAFVILYRIENVGQNKCINGGSFYLCLFLCWVNNFCIRVQNMAYYSIVQQTADRKWDCQTNQKPYKNSICTCTEGRKCIDVPNIL